MNKPGKNPSRNLTETFTDVLFYFYHAISTSLGNASTVIN